MRLHWLTILFCGGLLGAGMAYLAWQLLPAKYESYALFQVASNQNQVASQGDPTRGRTDFTTYLKTTASLFKSEFVYIAALRNPEYRLTDVPTLKAEKEPFKYLDEELIVDTKDGSEIIRLTLKGNRPEDIKRIVDAIKDAYIKEVVEREVQQKVDFRNQLQTAKTQLEDLLKRKAVGGKPVVGIAAVPGGEPLIALPGGDNPAAPVLAAPPVQLTDAERKARFPLLLQRVAKLEGDLPNYELQIAARKADAKASEEAIKQMTSAAIGAMTIEAATKDQDVMMAEGRAQRQRQLYERKKDSTTNPNSLEIVQMAANVAALEAAAKKLLGDRAKFMEASLRQPMFLKLNGEMNIALRDVTLLSQQRIIAMKQMEDAKRELAEMPPEINRYSKDKLELSEIEGGTLEDLYRRASTQLVIADFELKGPPRVRVLQSASAPIQKDTKKQLFGTIFAGLLGFVLVGACLIAFESKARKVSSLSELKTSNTTPVVGVIPWQPDLDTTRDPVRRSDISESIDKLRAYVVQSWLSRGATTVTVTSPMGDEGKAFTAFGLASSLAQAGYKTLLVDFDLRQPTLHPYAGVTNTIGVCDLLRGEADFRKSIQVLPSGLHFLAAGVWSDEARQAAVGERLETLLRRLKEPFDCVILHCHALLTAAESVEVARRSEVVLLCTQYRETRVPMLRRAAERIATMEIPYSGVVYLGSSAHEALC